MRELALSNLGLIANKVQQTKQEAKAIVSELQAAGAKVIKQNMPELLEPQNITGLYSYLTEKYGYKKEVIDNNVDPHLFIMAEKARRYDDMMSKSVKPDYVKERAHKARPKPKARQGMNNRDAAMSKFKSDPTAQNAAVAIRELLG
jgi:guanylate kinase